MFEEFKLWLRVVFDPSMWVQTYPQNKYWDEILREGLKNPKWERICQYVAEFDGRKIWIGNYPYAFGTARNEYSECVPLMASRRTVILLKESYDKFRVGGDE